MVKSKKTDSTSTAAPDQTEGEAGAAAVAPEAKAAATDAFRNRIKELRQVRADQLVPNPHNWRTHPEEQRQALRGILEEVGYVDAVIARELPDGRLEIVDGHLRAETTPTTIVPVLVVDLNDEEAAKILATFDPIGAMAASDDERLSELLSGIDTDSAALRQLLADLDPGSVHGEGEGQAGEATGEHRIHEMELQPHEHYDYLVVLATTTQDWNVLCEQLGLRPTARRGRMGTCRAIRADKLIEKLQLQQKPQ